MKKEIIKRLKSLKPKSTNSVNYNVCGKEFKVKNVDIDYMKLVMNEKQKDTPIKMNIYEMSEMWI